MGPLLSFPILSFPFLSFPFLSYSFLLSFFPSFLSILPFLLLLLLSLLHYFLSFLLSPFQLTTVSFPVVHSCLLVIMNIISVNENFSIYFSIHLDLSISQQYPRLRSK